MAHAAQWNGLDQQSFVLHLDESSAVFAMDSSTPRRVESSSTLLHTSTNLATGDERGDGIRVKQEDEVDSPKVDTHSAVSTPRMIGSMIKLEYHRGYSMDTTVSTEAYNTAYAATPRSDFSTPEPTSFWRKTFSDHEYAHMGAIQEDEYEAIDPVESTENTETNSHTFDIASALGHLDLTKKRIERNSPSITGGAYSDIIRGTYNRREVAVKVARRIGLKPDDSAKKQVAREVVNWSKLRHKNVLTLLGFIIEPDGWIALVAPWQANGTVKEFIRGKSLCILFNVITGACIGLRYLHSKGLIHGDFRGDNILVSHKGEAVVADFGLSRQVKSKLLSSSASLGNVRWWAPELLQINAKHTVKSDVWAFGITVLELYSNDTPYAECNDGAVCVRLNESKLPLQPVPNIGRLWRLCNECWIVDPGSRPDMTAITKRLQIHTRGITPNPMETLRDACLHGETDIVEFMLTRTAPIGLRLEKDDTELLYSAARQGHLSVVQLLLRYGADGRPALHMAAERGDENILHRLLECGVPVDGSDSWNRTALYYASREGYTDNVRTLLRSGANANGPNCRSHSHYYTHDTPLSSARRGHCDVVILLLESGADVDNPRCAECGGRAETPLYAASKAGHELTVDALLHRGAATELTTGFFGAETPLYVAACSGRRAIVELLLRHGANVNAMPLILEAVCIKGDDSMVDLLIRAGAKSEYGQALSFAARSGKEEVVRVLLRHGADVNSRDMFSRTALHLAATSGHLAITDLLLQNGADVNARDKWLNTPLHFAGAGNHFGVVKLLLAYGASPDSSSPMAIAPPKAFEGAVDRS